MDLIVLTGIHTAGKSTVGQHLAEQGHEYEPEIAQRLIDDGHDGSVDGDTGFQELVFEHEAARDRTRETEAVVETWHIGNLAHAYQNADQDLQQRQEEYLEAVADSDAIDVHGLHLYVEPDRIWDRTDHFDEPDPAVEEFYAGIEDDIRSLYEDHEIPYTVIDTTEHDPDAVRAAAAEYVDAVL